MTGRTHRGRWTTHDREESIYRHVPFDVPPGAGGVSVELSYDVTTAVLDLGVFDPERFRGYSGGARTGFSITEQVATPGYIPGPLPPGEWRVLLGLYVVPPEGVDWKVTVSLGPVSFPPQPSPSPPRPRPPLPTLPAASGRRWLRGDLHAHSVHSDGKSTIDELAGNAVSTGLDFLAITDHNTVSHHPHLPDAGEHHGIELIPGQEVTTHRGHANCLGPASWVDFRSPPDRWLGDAHSGGALLSVNHPVVPWHGWNHEMARAPDLVELWHKTWDRRSPAPIEWWQRSGGVPVGGSDFHDPAEGDRLGYPTTLVEVGEEGVLDALATGRVALAAEPDGPVILRVEGEVVVEAIDDRPLRVVTHGGRSHRVGAQRMSIPDAGPGPHLLVGEGDRVVALTP